MFRSFSRTFTVELLIKHPFSEWLSRAQHGRLTCPALGSKKYLVVIPFKHMKTKTTYMKAYFRIKESKQHAPNNWKLQSAGLLQVEIA